MYLLYFRQTVKYRLFLKIQAEGDSDLLLGFFFIFYFLVSVSCLRSLLKVKLKTMNIN